MKLSSFYTAGALIFGNGAVGKVGEEVQKTGATKVLIVTDKTVRQAGAAEPVLDSLRSTGIITDIVDEVTAEPPFENLEHIERSIRSGGYELLIGVGGGSVLDVAKVLAVMLTNPGNVRDFIGIDKITKPGIPTILIPTTSGTGSEVTYNAIFTDTRDMVKKGIVSRYLLPVAAIVDPTLTLTVPPSVTAATGMDALVHAVESYISVRANHLTDGIALHAVKLISRSLRKAVFNGKDLKAREDMAMGSLLAGISLANAGVGAVHALAYPLGGKFKVSHGVANSLLLPHVMRFNVVSDLEKFADLAAAMGERTDGLSLREAADRAVHAMEKLAADIGIPFSLKEVGVSPEDIPSLAEEAGKIDRLLNNNPRWLSVKDIETIYLNAYKGGIGSGN